MAAHVNANGNDEEADGERDPPTPNLQARLWQHDRQTDSDDAGENERKPLAGIGPTAEVASLRSWRHLDHIAGGSTDLASCCKALNEAANHEQYWRSDTERGVSRREREHRRAQRHQNNTHGKSRPASQAIRERANEYRTDRPGQKADA